MRRSLKFQSPRSGKFVSDTYTRYTDNITIYPFQSPRSGKFVSDNSRLKPETGDYLSFNPLDRGNLYQIIKHLRLMLKMRRFQSPRSGKFVSDETEYGITLYLRDNNVSIP